MEIIYFALAAVLVSGLFVLAANQMKKASAGITNIKPEENLVFFRSSAWLDEGKMQWNVPIHGWIYIPENSIVRKSAFKKLLSSKYDLKTNASTETNLSERFNLLLSDNKRWRVIVISLAGKKYTLPMSKANGHIHTILRIPSEDFEQCEKNSLITFNVIKTEKESREFIGEVQLVSPNGYSIISDIDDTIKISQVTDTKKLFNNTFFGDFKAVNGMPEHYMEWSELGTSLHYVSSSPWHLYAPLLDFVNVSGFPWSSFELKYVRLKDTSIFNFFKSGTKTKPSQIEPILLRFPKRKFVLFGDSGEHDPEVYSGLMRKYPEQIIKIFIRAVENEKKSDVRFQTLFKNLHADSWDLFSEPNQLPTASSITKLQ